MLSTLAALAILSLGTVAAKTSAAGPTDLRCENRVEPNCVEQGSPRLSWKTQTQLKNWVQSAYHVIVASSLTKLESRKGDVWDSGKVESPESTAISFGGPQLSANKQYFWKVQTWDKAGKKSAWSQPSTWQMGLFAKADWAGAKWIGSNVAGPAPFLRRTFKLTGKVRRARLFASGLGYAELHLNGMPVAPNTEREPGYTNFDKRALYVAYDVTKQLKKGANCLGAILGTGWYDVHDVATWHFEKAAWRDRPKLLAELVIEYADGQQEMIVSDERWAVSTGPILTDGIYTGETYDARKSLAGWDTAPFDDQGWQDVKVMPEPKGKLAARVCPPVVIGESIKPAGITEPRPGTYIIDFGQNFSGHARIQSSEPAGQEVKLRYSERVGKDGMIDRAEIEKFMDKRNPPQPFQTDTYISDGKNNETWEQRFSYSGFRYMEVTGTSKPPKLEHFKGRFAHTDLKKAGSFECSNELLNKIQRATQYSYLSNAQSIFTDCPQREKNGWTGDAHLAAEAGLMNFDSVTLYEKWLDDLADAQFGDGRNSIIVPTWDWGSHDRHPAWDSAYPIIVNDLYRYTGDKTMVRKHYDHIKAYVDGLEAQTKDGVIPFDSLGDWLPWKTETPSQYTSTAFLYLDTKIVADSARLLGKTEDAEKYSTLAESTKKAFNDKYFDAEKGIYANGSQTALSTALYFGLVPEDRRDVTFAALVADVERQGHIDTGIIGAKNILRVLSEGGRSDLAYKLAARKEIPGWGHWIESGATTLWEDWKGESSLNHIMFGDVSNWFIQWIAGIGLDPKSPGFRHITFRPQFVGELTWAKGTHVSPYGLISSSWRKMGKSIELEVVVPANCTGTVLLPGGDTEEIGSGRSKFSVKS